MRNDLYDCESARTLNSISVTDAMSGGGNPMVSFEGMLKRDQQ